MQVFTSIIGWVFIALVILGATVPGFHFHVVFADDQTAMEFHRERAEQLAKKLAQSKKEQPCKSALAPEIPFI